MNSTVAAYTPLECLLLFQTLVAHGTEEQDFDRISNLLTNNALVKDGDTYDVTRLGADALRQLYLQLIRDELRAEEEVQEENTSRKRKLPTPPLPSIKDAQEYKEKLPLLVNRLYARYREYMTRAIQEDERQYAKIKQEIGEIERGEWDERILKEIRPTNGTSAEASRTNGASELLPQEIKVPGITKEQHQNSPHPSPKPEGQAINDVLSGKASKPSSPKVPDSRAPGFSPPLPEEGSIGLHGPSPLQTGLQGTPQIHPGQPQFQPPVHPGQHGLQAAFHWETPIVPPHIQPGYQYQFKAQHPQQHLQYPPQSHQGPFSSPHGAAAPPPHVPSSPRNQHPQPIVIPPPNGSHRPAPGSPAMPLDALADVAGQQYRAHSGSPMIQQGHHLGSSMVQQAPHGSPILQHGPQGPPVVQQGPPHGSPMLQHPHAGSPIMQHGPPPGFPYTPQQRPPSNPQGQWNQQQPMQFQTPSAQYPHPPHQRPSFQPPPNLVPAQPKTYNSPYNPNQESRPQVTPILRQNLPQTPLFRPPLQHKTGSGTVWTPNPSGSTPARGDFNILQSPAVEPISPILRPAKLPDKRTPKKKSPKKPEPEHPKTVQSADRPKKEPKAKTARRGVGRPRAGSVASSVIAGSHRSQSVISHADELSLDNEIPNRSVKQEVATPVGVDDAGDTTADELPPHPSRSGPSPRQSTKRKRASSIPLESRTPIEIRPSVPPTHVLWTRAFPKISMSALEAISGHKNASTFSHPVKERDAPGYTKIILRPQDLASIRKAISAGGRAAAAAAPEDLPASATNAWLPISEDIVPPKGIINYAQLEKELMRMFANAIMFNADPDRGLGRRWQGIGKSKGDVIGYEIDEDGVVKDTKAMFAEVEKTVGNLRSAERRNEETRESSMARAVVEDDDVDELAGDADSHVGTTGTVKRRRKA